MFRVTIPTSRAVERRYILKTLLQDFLGLEFRVEEAPEARAVIIRNEDDSANRTLVVADEFFTLNAAEWLTEKSVPRTPLTNYPPPARLGFASEYSVPVIFGGRNRAEAGDVSIDFDLFGSAFFLLTRYEEVAIPTRDAHGRFQAKDSVMFKAGVLDRPLVDEYTLIVRRAIEALWPGTKFKRHEFKIVPTHDVDVPYEYLFVPTWRAVRRAGARLALERSLTRAKNTLGDWRKVRNGNDSADPFYSALVRMMEMNEKAGLHGRFYFIAGHTSAQDGDYEIEHPRIRKLLRMVHERGHAIGLHPSYGTLGKVDLLKQELERLLRVCREEKISQREISVRSHYLRWDSRHSFRDFDAVGFDFDSTMTFAEHAGFRCGTCREFTAFDVATGTPLRMREQPLVAMECSVLQSYYQGLAFDAASAYFSKLKARCRQMDGQYIFLWHNSRFPTAEDWELYRQQVEER
jgi:hypothetical protein